MAKNKGGGNAQPLKKVVNCKGNGHLRKIYGTGQRFSQMGAQTSQAKLKLHASPKHAPACQTHACQVG